MESRIPLPTDNIYKFYALFGLLLLIFSMGAMVYVSNSTNNLIYESAVDYEVLKADPSRSVAEEARFKLLEKKFEIAAKNKKVFLYFLGVVVTVGAYMMFYGFKKWHTEVQPMQDEMARLALKKLKQDVGEGPDA